MTSFEYAVLILLGIAIALLVAVMTRGYAPITKGRTQGTRVVGILSAPGPLSEEQMINVRDRIEKSFACGARAFVVDKGMEFRLVEVCDDGNLFNRADTTVN